MTQKVSVVMRTVIDIMVGDWCKYSYSHEVAAGPPSDAKDFHATHSDKDCKVIEIVSKTRQSLWVKAEFADGDIREMNTDWLIWLRRPSIAGTKTAKSKLEVQNK